MRLKEVKVNKDQPNVTKAIFEYESNKEEQWFLLRSDIHWDSKDSDVALERKHLKQALERNAYIVTIGDMFDAMQGKEDRRRSLSALKDEFVRTDYFDALIEKSVEFYKPYAKNMLLISKGNHENAIT
jgi:hypothetical protein